MEAWPSAANFVLVRTPHATHVRERLRDEYSILVRDFSYAPGLADCLRITVGTPQENDEVLACVCRAGEGGDVDGPLCRGDPQDGRDRHCRKSSTWTEAACAISRPACRFSTTCSTLLAAMVCSDLTVHAVGDVEVDAHHTVEDTGIVLGEAFCQALGDKAGITRFADAAIAMDETLVMAAVDISGRGQAYCELPVPTERVGSFRYRAGRRVLYAFARDAKLTLHVASWRAATRITLSRPPLRPWAARCATPASWTPRVQGIPSTKGFAVTRKNQKGQAPLWWF